MTNSMRSVADFLLNMIGQCSNLDQLLAVQRNPSFTSRLETLQEHAEELGYDVINAVDAKRAEFGSRVKMELLGMERMGIRGPEYGAKREARE